MTTPQLAIIHDDALNAFASGLFTSEYTITITTGLLTTLDRDEIEAVLAHELTHLKNKDAAVMMVSNMITCIFETIINSIKYKTLNMQKYGTRYSSDFRSILFTNIFYIFFILLSLVITIKFNNPGVTAVFILIAFIALGIIFNGNQLW